jgi:hypothetical protein
VGGESPPALVQTVKDGLALITHGIRSIFNNSLERPRLDLPPALSSAASLSSLRQQQLSPAVSGHTVSDDWQFITDMDELTRNYFQRWALTVQHDTDRLIATHRQRERFRNWEKTGAKAGVALLLDEELVLDMESQLGEFELIHVSCIRVYVELVMNINRRQLIRRARTTLTREFQTVSRTAIPMDR